MKILHISTHDFAGGAARAAYRIHRALMASGIDSRMLVLVQGSGDESVYSPTPAQSIAAHLNRKVYQRWVLPRQRNFKTDNPVLHTFGQVGAGLVDEINNSDADILNLHWVSRMLSVSDIGRLQKPVVWTLHDMWAFCGGEHYAPDNERSRFRLGYLADNRPQGECGPDLNRQTWEKKRRLWTHQPFTVVSPSNWLAECARQSFLFKETTLKTIRYPIDIGKIWKPIARDAARTVLDLPHEKKMILFGAHGGVADSRKGADLLLAAVKHAAAKLPGELELLIYGQSRDSSGVDWPCPVHWLGAVRDDRVLSQAYSAADVMIVPSRQDNLPLAAIEAQACGTPVVAFNIGGLPDIVDHGETGWLADPFDTDDIAEGILWLLADEERNRGVAALARQRAIERYSEPVIAKEYCNLYEQVLTRN